MAILSECRDDTEDMLWDICKETDETNNYHIALI